MLGPRTHTPAPTARRWRTPTARPVGGQSGEGERLASDAPHNGGRRPPRRRPSATPTASNAGTQGCTLWGRCGSPRPHRPYPGHTGRGTPAARPRGRAAGGGTAPDTRRPSQRWKASPPRDGPPPPPQHAVPTGHAGQGGQCWAPTPTHLCPQHVGGGPQQPAHWTGSRGRGSAWPQTPLTTVEGTPPGDTLLPGHSEQRWPARAHAVRGAGAGSPRPLRPRPGHMGRRTPAARPRGRAAWGGTAPDTRRPSQRWQADPPGTGPDHPCGTQPPQGMQAKGTVLGPLTRTPAPTARR